jgi:glycosyltransferase involved in cell wall biosynthesis
MIFSIIVPVCNAETFLEESVLSAVNQDIGYDIYEIILLENGSKDDSPRICDELAGRYENVRAVHRGKTGLYGARQYGIREAKGDFILALDADDLLVPDAISRLLKSMDQCRAESGAVPDVIIFDARALRGDGRSLFERPFEAGRIYRGAEKKIFFDALCTDDSLNTMWTKCIRRTIADLGKPDIFLNYGEDLYQTAYYLDRAESVMYLDQILYEYRVDAPSMSTSYSEVYLDNQKITWSGLDEIAGKWEDGAFDDIISRRKSLTCTIAMTRLIYSDMGMKEKKHKLGKLLQDDFYREYASYPLPEWAPEEAVFVKNLQMQKDPESALLKNALVSGIKRSIKKTVGRS